MQKESISSTEDEPIRPACENWTPSIFQSSRKDDIIYFRMDTPLQLEKEYDFGPLLGEGSFGVVYSGRRKKDNAKCAIKKIPRERAFSASERARLDREISILRYVKHPGIIELYAVAESPTFLFLITELCEGNSLAKCMYDLPEGYGLEEYIVVDIIRQVASALSYLHNRGIVHRDLKAGNIMLLHHVVLDKRRISFDEPYSTKNQHIESKKKESSEDSIRSYKESIMPSIFSDKHVIKPYIPYPNSDRSHQTRATTAKTRKQAATTNLVVNARPRKSAPLSTPLGSLKRETPNKVERKLPPSTLRTKLIDFGLAIEVRKNEEALASTCGTPLYMAPEVLNGRSYTRQCDVWSLGILMFILLTNKTPFTAQTEEELISELNHLDIKSIIDHLVFVTPSCQNCLLRVLHMDPAYRYSASELLLDPWCSQFDALQMANPKDADNDDFNHEDEDSVFKSLRDSNTEGGTKSNILTFATDYGSGKSLRLPTSRPPSVGATHSGSTYSATNVLELMKQYHKELTGAKRDQTSERE